MSESVQQRGIGVLYAVVIDVNDLATCSTFWSQVLGMDVVFQDDLYCKLEREGEFFGLLLQKVPEPRQGKNRVHLDIDVADLEPSVRQVEGLGGRRIGAGTHEGNEWVVMADPDGNEFCVVKHV